MPRKIPDAEMFSLSFAMTRAYTEQAHDLLTSFLTNPTRFRDAAKRFQTSYCARLAGDPAIGGTFEEDRKELNNQYVLLAGMAKNAAQHDPSVPEKLGLGRLTAKTSTSASPLAKPGEFKVVHGQNSGEMIGQIPYMNNIRIFEVWGCAADPGVEQNWKLLAASPNCRGIVIKGLTPGTKYWLRIRAMHKNQGGPWSNYVFLMAI